MPQASGARRPTAAGVQSRTGGCPLLGQQPTGRVAASPANTLSWASVRVAFSLESSSMKATGVKTSFSYCCRHSLRGGRGSGGLCGYPFLVVLDGLMTLHPRRSSYDEHSTGRWSRTCIQVAHTGRQPGLQQPAAEPHLRLRSSTVARAPRLPAAAACAAGGSSVRSSSGTASPASSRAACKMGE